MSASTDYQLDGQYVVGSVNTSMPEVMHPSEIPNGGMGEQFDDDLPF